MSKLVQCFYTEEWIPIEQAVRRGAVVPGVLSDSYMKNTPEVKEMHRQSQIAFHESEANCNTCKHLQRVPHEKTIYGFLEGKCKKDGKDLKFHPDDPMFMTCYKSRWK